MASDLGIAVDLKLGDVRLDRVLFAEGGSRIVVSVKAERLGDWEALIRDHADLPVTHLGAVTTTPRLTIQSDQGLVMDLGLDQCLDAYDKALPRRISSGIDVQE